MLETKNLTKIYNSKGVEVRALDDVSISFAETGMCFILGKSGSGKSTLLNVCGGLDYPDSGEIIVRNRSSKDFTNGDFDSYRNTYIGFVFQEYNILDEFTVEENVMLALDLQGRSRDAGTVDEILRQVDLEGLGKRRPNTLSGGQKQRVAIARALVKNPEIIMADEPTGALDSATGKQVLDTLKKLSQSKLVIVVSHDREFAEKYADRIIELKDGKVISDVTKRVIEGKGLSDNVSEVKPATLIVRKGIRLTDEDIEKIRNVVEKADTDVLITADVRGVDEYRQSHGITNTNGTQSFVATAEQPKQRQYTDAERKFIRSSLPLKHAVRIGASGIKVKPVRFAFTLLLSIISFVMFGLFSCLMFYDSDTVMKNSLAQYDMDYIKLSKQYLVYVDYYMEGGGFSDVMNIAIPMLPEDTGYTAQLFGNGNLYVTNINANRIGNLSSFSSEAYTNQIQGIVEDNGELEYIYGKSPEGDSAAISDYLYQCIKTGRLSDPDTFKTVNITSYEDIVLQLQSDSGAYKSVKVSGVFRSDDIWKPWESYDSTMLMLQRNTIEQCLSDLFISYVAISPDSYGDFVSQLGTRGNYFNLMTSSVAGASINVMGKGFDKVSEYTLESLKSDSVCYDADGTAVTLTSDAFVLPFRLINMSVTALCKDIEKAAEEDLVLSEKYNSIAYNEVYYFQLSENLSNSYWNNDKENYLKDYRYLTQFVKDNLPDLWQKFNKVTALCNIETLGDGNLYFTFDFENCAVTDDVRDRYIAISKLSGAYSEYKTSFDTDSLKNARYFCVFAPSDSFENVSTIIDGSNVVREDDTKYSVNNFVRDSVWSIDSLVTMLSDVFLWTGVTMAVFSMLLLFNFITVSVNAKKKEIGILRAVGARGADVFRIFFSESAIVVVICSIVATILTGVIALVINGNISTRLGFPFTMFTFGFVSVALIWAISVFTAVISTFFPVYANARKRPVESIRSL